jgi:integrase
VLGIENLRFHDLRHDGISRLFELGKTIPQAACVSGHRSWVSLRRYTHIEQSGDKYAQWPFIAGILEQARNQSMRGGGSKSSGRPVSRS